MATREQLIRERELLLEKKQLLTRKADLQREIAPPRLIPTEVSQIGRGIEERIAGAVPPGIQPGVRGALRGGARALGEAALPGIFGAPATRLVEHPEETARAVIARQEPVGTILGFGARKLAQTGRGRELIGKARERLAEAIPTTAVGRLQTEFAKRISPERFQQIGEALAETGGFVGGAAAAGRFAPKIRPGLARRARLQRRVEAAREPLPRQIGRKIAETRKVAQKELQQIAETTRQRVQITTNQLKGDAENLQRTLQKTAEVRSRASQGKIRTFARRSSNAYGRELDKISDNLVKAGDRGITRGEQIEIINKTIKETDDLFLTTGPARQKVEQLGSKYSLDKLQDVTQLDEFLEFKEVVSDMRSVGKVVSAQAKIRGFTPEDVVAAIYKKNFGEVIANKVPEFAKLQKGYAPVIQAIKQAHKTFNTFRGEFLTKRGTEFLKRAGVGKLEAGEQRFLETIEKGTRRFGKGIGKISKEVTDVGKQLTEAKKVIQIQKQRIIATGNKARIERIGTLEQRLRLLEARKLKAEQLLRTQAAEKVKAGAGAKRRGEILRTILQIGAAIGIVKFLASQLGGGGFESTQQGGQ